jgi:uncharacterized protein with HEPN domain
MSDAARLADIIERIDRIQRSLPKREADFLGSEVVQDAVIRNLEVIGEAAKGVSEPTRRRFKSVPWREMGRFRDLAIHHYGNVLAEEVWQIVAKDLSAIRRSLAKVVPATEPARRIRRR